MTLAGEELRLLLELAAGHGPQPRLCPGAQLELI